MFSSILKAIQCILENSPLQTHSSNAGDSEGGFLWPDRLTGDCS